MSKLADSLNTTFGDLFNDNKYYPELDEKLIDEEWMKNFSVALEHA